MNHLRCSREVQFLGESAKNLKLSDFHRSISNTDGIHIINLLDEYANRDQTRLSG
jgi:hypothetical protein